MEIKDRPIAVDANQFGSRSRRNTCRGAGLGEKHAKAVTEAKGATVFAYHVEHPERYGVVSFDAEGRATSIVEKPKNPESPWAVTGLYVYDNRVLDIAASVKPSIRGELEITSVNDAYLQMGELHVQRLGRGFAWLDTGTHDSLLEASEFVRTIQKRQNIQIACLEEIAFEKGFIALDVLRKHGETLCKTSYGKYLLCIAANKNS
jgi:glucose-1-phosphate thymidylyltransferase